LSSTPEVFAPRVDRRFFVLALIGALAATAWIAIALWSASPYARYLDHGSWLEPVWLGELCRLLPQGQLLVPAIAYAGAWLLMIVAMMLPTTLPLLGIFSRIAGGRTDSGRLVALVALGYVIAWGAFGLVAHAADAGVHAIVAESGWLTAHGWVVGALVLAGAGAFQFSSLKYRCLERCRTPFGFVNARWRGVAPAREALRIGVDHGLFCVACCWALMLVMFVVGMGNLGWMLVIAAVMAAEKNLPWGRSLRTPLGVGLVSWAAVLAFNNLL
jgi:predicted metal-binding membrane protein